MNGDSELPVLDPRLLAAAKEEFLKKGYEKSSLVCICEAAGVTTGALYKRYKGKEDQGNRLF